ncbi:hypothetical protein Tco_1123810 [Tanacetum coccineum]|uniref:Uncharacterized protein n=1 Tax=Tanacetum coccineum TaxID=301880 RepID=A0ABQ5J4D4_9ASTR
MYGLRAMLEKKKEFSEINGHLFQVVLFIFESLGTLAVYAFAEGVKSKLAKNIGIMKMFMLIIWIEGLGFDIFYASQSFVIAATTVLCWAVKQVLLDFVLDLECFDI